MAEPCRVGKEYRDQERGKCEWDGETDLPETVVDVLGIDDAVVVSVPEEDMLLEGAQRLFI